MLEHYEIRLCRGDEGAQLREFIGSHWKPNHVLALSQELLDWQHLDAKGGVYNFVVAAYKPTGAFHAVYGFIPVSHFDPALKEFQRLLARDLEGARGRRGAEPRDVRLLLAGQGAQAAELVWLRNESRILPPWRAASRIGWAPWTTSTW